MFKVSSTSDKIDALSILHPFSWSITVVAVLSCLFAAWIRATHADIKSFLTLTLASSLFTALCSRTCGGSTTFNAPSIIMLVAFIDSKCIISRRFSAWYFSQRANDAAGSCIHNANALKPTPPPFSWCGNIFFFFLLFFEIVIIKSFKQFFISINSLLSLLLIDVAVIQLVSSVLITNSFATYFNSIALLLSLLLINV